MTRKVLRWVVPADDGWHTFTLTGPIVHVATRAEDGVEFWCLDDDAGIEMSRTFRIYGTGQPGVEGEHVGSAITPSGRFVWHLFEYTGGTP